MTTHEEPSRFARIVRKAEELFEEDKQAAMHWLNTPQRALNRQKPIDLIQADAGACLVEDLIGRLEHGVIT